MKMSIDKKEKKKKKKKEKKQSSDYNKSATNNEKKVDESFDKDITIPYGRDATPQQQENEKLVSLSSDVIGNIREKMGLHLSLLDSSNETNQPSHDDIKMIPAPFSRNCLCSLDEEGTKETSRMKNELAETSIMQLARNVFISMLQKSRKKQNNSSQGKNMLSSISPTPIQLQTWSILSHAQDTQMATNNDCETSVGQDDKTPNIIAIAPTGSGKTLCYGIPLIQSSIMKIMQHFSLASNHNKSGDNIHGIILVPTRELAIQVSKELKIVAKVANRLLCSKNQQKANSNMKQRVIQILAIYGGVSKEEQYQSLLGQSNEKKEKLRTIIIAATPGRFIDLITTSSSSISSVKTHKKNNYKENDENVDADKSVDTVERTSIDSSIQPLFQQLHSIIIDEADRMAINKDVCNQVDCIMNLIRSLPTSSKLMERKDSKIGIQSVCLYSATYPQNVKNKFKQWILPNKQSILIKVNAMTLNSVIDKKEKIKASTEGVASMQNDDNHDLKEEKQASEVIDKLKDEHLTSTEEGEEKPHSAADDSNAKKKRKRGEQMEIAAIPSHVTQILHVCATHKKPKKLLTTISKIRKDENSSNPVTGRRRQQGLIIVFFATIKTSNFISKMLYKEGIRCVEINSHLNQQRRERALNDFRCGKIPILLATDIAARGIHVNNIEYVVNYDFPSSLEQYVHRCGRTGRKQLSSTNTQIGNQDHSKENLNRSAMVYSFFHRELAPMANDVINLLEQCEAWIDPNLRELLSNDKKKKRRNNDNKSSKNTSRKSEHPHKKKIRSDINECHSDEGYDDGEFSALGSLRIVLKRASHVSDAEDSSDDENISKEN